MPPRDRVRYYPAFPPAVPQRGVGCIRVTHPCATLMDPKVHLPSDLHVLGLPLAFILSQDQTLLCTIVLTYCYLFSGPALLSLIYAFCLYLHGPASLRRQWTCLAGFSSFQRTPDIIHTLLASRSPVECGCKSRTFSDTKRIRRKIFCTFWRCFCIRLAKCCVPVYCRALFGNIFAEFCRKRGLDGRILW